MNLSVKTEVIILHNLVFNVRAAIESHLSTFNGDILFLITMDMQENNALHCTKLLIIKLLGDLIDG